MQNHRDQPDSPFLRQRFSHSTSLNTLDCLPKTDHSDSESDSHYQTHLINRSRSSHDQSLAFQDFQPMNQLAINEENSDNSISLTLQESKPIQLNQSQSIKQSQGEVVIAEKLQQQQSNSINKTNSQKIRSFTVSATQNIKQMLKFKNNHKIINIKAPRVKNECRICYSTEAQKDIIYNCCDCKGSLAYVHEKCMIKWLMQKGTRSCDICKRELNIVEKFASIKQIFKKNLQYVFKNKKRFFNSVLYCLYIFFCLNRIKVIVRSLFDSLIQYKNYKLNSAYTFEKIKKIYNMTGRQRMMRLLIFTLKLLKVFYQLVLLCNLCVLGLIESVRIKNIFKFVISNSKTMKIQQIKKSDKNEKSPS